MLAGRIESGSISFEELYAFCNSVGEYWLLSEFFITLRSDDENLVNLVNAHKELLTKSETIFFIYVEALVRLGRAEDAKAYFLEMMMTAEGEEHERAECVFIQLLHGLSECSDEDE